MEQPDIDDHLSRDARERLQQTLAPGETLLWAAAPIPRLHLLSHIPGFISGLISIGVPLYIVIPFCSADSNLPTVARALVILFLIPFILPGLHSLARPWIERRRRRNMIAAVTDRRCLLLYPRLFRSPGLCEWPLCYHSVDEQPDGSGDIIFISPAHTRHIETRGPNSFPDIPRVRCVQHIIDNAARAAAPSPEPGDDSDDDSDAPPPRRKLIGGIVGGTIALLIAVGLAIPLAITTRSSYRIIRDYLPATATVTHVEWSEDLARAHYRFTLDGQSYTGREQTASNVGVKQVGERIDILYNPNNPAENSPRSFFDLWLLPLILGILFLVFAAFGTLSFINVRKVRLKGPPAPTLPDGGRTAPPPRQKLIGGTIALLIAIGLSIPLAITTRSSYRIIRDYLPATATVTHVEWTRSHSRHGSSSVARAHYRFTLDGQSYTGREQTASNVGVKQVGERIDILYNPNNPAENSPRSFFDLWFLPIFLGFFLLLAATLSILSFRTYRKERRKDTATPRD